MPFSVAGNRRLNVFSLLAFDRSLFGAGAVDVALDEASNAHRASPSRSRIDWRSNSWNQQPLDDDGTERLLFRTLAPSRHRLGNSVHTAPLHTALIIAAATDGQPLFFVWETVPAEGREYQPDAAGGNPELRSVSRHHRKALVLPDILFASWSDGGAVSHSMTAAASSLTLVHPSR